jgi:hypothetical protein
MSKEKYSLVGPDCIRKALNDNPDYKVFYRAGFAFRGAGEKEDDKQPHEEYIYQERRKRVLTFEERMQRRYDWAAALDIDIDHDAKEIHINGFSENDLY